MTESDAKNTAENVVDEKQKKEEAIFRFFEAKGLDSFTHLKQRRAFVFLNRMNWMIALPT